MMCTDIDHLSGNCQSSTKLWTLLNWYLVDCGSLVKKDQDIGPSPPDHLKVF